MYDIPSVDLNNDIEINFSGDESEAFITLQNDEVMYTEEQLLTIIKNAGITKGIDQDAVKKIISDKIYNTQVRIAANKKAENGKDGWFEFLFKTDIDTKPKILKDGSVDYSSYGDVPTVVQDQEIAIYHRAVPGVDGESVKGETILAKKGRDLARLKGRGFYLNDTSDRYYAKYDGKITYIDERLVVDNELLIEGDVSYTTGNVEFQNDIHIRGNVLTGVKITSEKGSIIVDGYVESAVLSAKHDVVLKNGMQGNGKGYIEAGGNVTGKFFEQVKIKAAGDVNANAIMNSDIECDQDVIVSGKFGIIIGGSVKATRYINTTIIGNMSEVRTVIEAGVDKDLFALLSKKEQDKAKAEEEMEKINKAIEQIQILIDKTGRDDLNQKKVALMRAKIEKDTSINKLTKNIQEVVEKMGKANLAKVTIDKVVYPGTIIKINGMKVAVKEENHHVEYARRGSGIIVYNIGE